MAGRTPRLCTRTHALMHAAAAPLRYSGARSGAQITRHVSCARPAKARAAAPRPLPSLCCSRVRRARASRRPRSRARVAARGCAPVCAAMTSPRGGVSGIDASGLQDPWRLQDFAFDPTTMVRTPVALAAPRRVACSHVLSRGVAAGRASQRRLGRRRRGAPATTCAQGGQPASSRGGGGRGTPRGRRRRAAAFASTHRGAHAHAPPRGLPSARLCSAPGRGRAPVLLPLYAPRICSANTPRGLLTHARSPNMQHAPPRGDGDDRGRAEPVLPGTSAECAHVPARRGVV